MTFDVFFQTVTVTNVDTPWDETEVAEVAARYFECVTSDLIKSGGVRIDRARPLRRSPEFASAVYDQLAIILARKYHGGELDYETADWFANKFEGELVDLIIAIWPKKDGPCPSRWSEVYEAFDAGEFDHFGRSTDPVAEFTNPQIAAFLAKHG